MKQKPKELDWVNILNCGDIVKIRSKFYFQPFSTKHGMSCRLDNFIKKILAQQRTELLEEIKERCEFEKVKNWKGEGYSDSYLSGYQKAYEEVEKELFNLLNKKDE